MSLFLCLILHLEFFFFFFQITVGSSSRSRSTDGQLFTRHRSTNTESPRTSSDSTISPTANFDTPPELSAFLDNSAAKHKLLIKPRNQRSGRIRKFSQVHVKINSATFDTNPESSYWILHKLRHDIKSFCCMDISLGLIAVNNKETLGTDWILQVYLLPFDAVVYGTISS